MIDGRVESMITLDTAITFLATNSGGVDETVTLAAGDYYMTSAGGVTSVIAALQTALIADAPPATGTWTVAFSTTTGQVTIECTGAGTFSLTWASTELPELFGFAGDLAAVSGAQTGAAQAKSVWFPDCTLFLEGELHRAPTASDLRTTRSPRGKVLGLIGNTWGQHKGCTWSHVPRARIREVEATLDNASWETFFEETQLGFGISILKPASLVQIYAHDGTLVGADGNAGSGMRGWAIEGLSSSEVQRASGQWDGLWQVTFPTLIGEFN